MTILPNRQLPSKAEREAQLLHMLLAYKELAIAHRCTDLISLSKATFQARQRDPEFLYLARGTSSTAIWATATQKQQKWWWLEGQPVDDRFQIWASAENANPNQLMIECYYFSKNGKTSIYVVNIGPF